jgi:hypothetical protein
VELYLFSPICLHDVDSDFIVYLFVIEYINCPRKSEDFDPALVTEDHMWAIQIEKNAFIKTCRFKADSHIPCRSPAVPFC